MTERDARRVVAGLVFVATVLACLWIGTYTVPSAVAIPQTTQVVGLINAPRHTPSWAIPLAVVVGVVGLIIALRILRPYREKP